MNSESFVVLAVFPGGRKHFSARGRVPRQGVAEKERQRSSAVIRLSPRPAMVPDGPPRKPIPRTVVIVRRRRLSRRRRLHDVRLPSHRGVYLPPDCLGFVLPVRVTERTARRKDTGRKKGKNEANVYSDGLATTTRTKRSSRRGVQKERPFHASVVSRSFDG